MCRPPLPLLLLALIGCTPAAPTSPRQAPEFTTHAPLLEIEPTPLGGAISIANGNGSRADWDLVITETVSLRERDQTLNAQLERSVRVQGIQDATGHIALKLTEAVVTTHPSNPSWIEQQSELMNGLMISMKRTEDAVTIELPEDLSPTIAPHMRAIGLALLLLIPPALPAEVSPDSSWTLDARSLATTKRTLLPLGTTPCGDEKCVLLASTLALSETVETSSNSARVSAKGNGRGQAIVSLSVTRGIPVSGRMNYSIATSMTARGETAQASTLTQNKHVEVTMRAHEDPSR
jgi:hypothetical protein